MARIKYLKCRFCPNITGSVQVPEKLNHKKMEDITLEDLGIFDVRCTDCESTHGTIQEMKRRYEKNVPEHSPEEFNQILEDSGYSKTNFDSNVEAKELEKRQQRRQQMALKSGIRN